MCLLACLYIHMFVVVVWLFWALINPLICDSAKALWAPFYFRLIVCLFIMYTHMFVFLFAYSYRPDITALVDNLLTCLHTHIFSLPTPVTAVLCPCVVDKDVSTCYLFNFTGNGSVVRVPDLWSKGHGYKSRQKRQENLLLQGRLSGLALILVPVPSCVTTVVRKNPGHSAKCAGGRLQLLFVYRLFRVAFKFLFTLSN